MADNVEISAGTGTPIATDDIGGVQFQRIKIALGASNAYDADVDSGQQTSALSVPVVLASDQSAIPVNVRPATSGGCDTYHVVAASGDNVANIKASAGQVFGIDVFNNAAYPVFVKLHNTAGTPTAGAGVVRTVGVQAGLGRHLAFPSGLAFATGIGISIVKGITDASGVVVVASDCVVDVEYK